MILKAFIKTKDTTPTNTLAILENLHGTVQVYVVDEHGAAINGGCLITFYTDGTLRLATNISSKLGFKFDSRAAIAQKPYPRECGV